MRLGVRMLRWWGVSDDKGVGVSRSKKVGGEWERQILHRPCSLPSATAQTTWGAHLTF